MSSEARVEVAVDGLGLKARAARPVVLSMEGRLKESFREMGRPCSGPIGVPVRERCASRERACARAPSKRGSVRQRVSCWAIAARCSG